MRTHDRDREQRLLAQLTDGQLGLDEFLRRLAVIAVPAGVDPDGGEGYIRGTVDTLQSAVSAGVIDDADWDVVLQHAVLAPNLLATINFTPLTQDDVAPCRCVRLPDESGRWRPQAWVAAHDEVRVRSFDGRSATGWTVGLLQVGTPDGPELEFIVEPDGGEEVGFTFEEIATVTPLAGITARAEFAARVLNVLEAVMTTGERVDPVRLILDAHTNLEVSFERGEQPCLPVRWAEGS